MRFLRKLVFSIFCLQSNVFGCPPPEEIAPHCKCIDFYGDDMMTCEGVLSPEQIIPPLRAVAASRSKIFALNINNSSLLYIPDGVFEGVHVEKIYFLGTQIMSLSDTDVAFRGLENSLTELRATNEEYIAQWDWSDLKNLKALDLIDVNNIAMGSIDEPFPHLPKLTALGITRATISYIEDGAFSELPKLQIINMKENDITELKRNMFPDPADKLNIMDFRNNEIESLPDDFFNNMPSISQVFLDNNKFLTLSENSFSPAFQILSDLTLTGNPIRCDCRMRWLVDMRVPFVFNAVCSAPESLKGVSVDKLDLKSLYCLK